MLFLYFRSRNSITVSLQVVDQYDGSNEELSVARTAKWNARYVLRILDKLVLLVHHAYKPLLEPYGNIGCRMPHCDNILMDALLQHLNVLSP